MTKSECLEMGAAADKKFKFDSTNGVCAADMDFSYRD